jgi:hypothetical protein
VQEAKGNPHCRRLSLRPKKTLVLRRGTTLSFSTSAGGIRGEYPEQNSPEKSLINQLPAKTFFSEILQSPLKCFLVLGKPRERACFKGSESSTVSPCRSPGSSSNSRSRLDLCGTTTCAPVRKKAPVVVFFSVEENRATTEQNFRFEAFPSDLLLYSFFRGFGKSENPTSRGDFKLFWSTYTISNHSLLQLHSNKKHLDRWVPR